MELPRNDEIQEYAKFIYMRNDLYRIIDANINRASEALRVIEEWARFSKDNTKITEKLKKIRHYINSSFLQNDNLIFSRESNFDIGREIENTSKKSTVRNIIKANCKRAEEALRVLGEYGQLLNLNAESLKNIEESRYEIYSTEKELLENEKLLRLQNAQLYLVAGKNTSTERLNDKDFFSIIEKSIEGGIDIIQLREKNENETKIIELAKEIRNLVRNSETLFIINDRVDIALACDADGVHLGQDDFPVYEARKITPPGFLIGLSTHSEEQGEKSLKSGADYLGVGPVFQTPTKPDYIPATLNYVKWANENLTLPWFAIGGIDEINIDKVINAGAKKVAVVRAIMNAKNPELATKTLKDKLSGSVKTLFTTSQ